MSSKLPTELSIEELLKALDEKPSDSKERIDSHDDMFNFIQAFDMRRGTYKVTGILLYELYIMWTKEKKISKQAFNIRFKKYFEFYNTSKKLTSDHYKLNKSVFDIAKQLEKYRKPKPYKNVKGKAVQKIFVEFIEKHNITRGSLYVESDVFYHVYDTYMYNNKRKSLEYTRFINLCRLFFDYKYFDGSDLIWFGLSDNIKNYISPQGVANWRQGRKKRGKRSSVKKEQECEIIYPETQADKETGS